VAKWITKETYGKHQISAQSFGFDAAVLFLPITQADFNAPSPLAASIKVNIDETNRTAQQELDWQSCTHATSYTGDVRLTVRLTGTF
jgi:hypothetical protein